MLVRTKADDLILNLIANGITNLLKATEESDVRLKTW